MVARVAATVEREHGITLSIDASAIDALIAAGGYDPVLGARPMRRTVGRLLEARLARAVLGGELSRGDSVLARGCSDHIEFERTRAVATDAAE
jgi:ATP-dependent Clp protease ATP-binding subunit ClpC